MTSETNLHSPKKYSRLTPVESSPIIATLKDSSSSFTLPQLDYSSDFSLSPETSPTRNIESNPALNNFNFDLDSYDTRCWAVLAGFSSLSFASGLAWITFAPRADSFKKYYELPSTSKIDSLSTIFMITYPIFLLPALYLGQFFLEKERKIRQGNLKYFNLADLSSESISNDNAEVSNDFQNSQGFGYGIKHTLILASALHTIGCWFRYFAGKNFWVVWFGQALTSLCQVFTLGMPPKLASVWFHPKKQNVAIAIGVTANVLGSAAGFLLTPIAVNPLYLDDSVPKYFFAQSFIYTLQLMLFIFVFPVAPKCPPSCEVPTEPSASTVFSSTLELLKKPAFRSLAISYGLVVGGQYTVQTLLISLILPFFIEHTESEVSWLGFWMLILGILASLVGGWFLDRTHSYFKFSVVLFILTTLSLLLMNMSIDSESFIPLSLSCLLYGMSSSTLIPSLFQYGITQFQTSSFSNDDASTIPGLLNFFAQVVGIILINLMSGNPTSTILSSWFLLYVTFAGMIFLGLSCLGSRN